MSCILWSHLKEPRVSFRFCLHFYHHNCLMLEIWYGISITSHFWPEVELLGFLACEQAPWGALRVYLPVPCLSPAPRAPKRACSKPISFATGHIAHYILSLQWCKLVERRKQSRHWSLSFKFCDIWFVRAWKPWVSYTVAIYIVAFRIFFSFALWCSYGNLYVILLSRESLHGKFVMH